MVLAKMLSKQQREEGIAIGRAEGVEEGVKKGIREGIKEERKRSNAKLRAWAKEKGIPVEELPMENENE